MYANEDEQNDEMLRSTSVNPVSQFMLKFTAKLENVIKTDIKDENTKTEIVLRSHSNYMDNMMSPSTLHKELEDSPMRVTVEPDHEQ
jgi:hypothetical protein